MSSYRARYGRTLRRRVLDPLRTTDLREILNTPKGAAAAVRFTLLTGLLRQFDKAAERERAKSTRDATLPQLGEVAEGQEGAEPEVRI